MAIWSYPLTFSIIFVLTLSSCRGKRRDVEEELNNSPIAYPFYGNTRPIGKNANTDKVVIRSMTTQAEYALELPGSANTYDLEVPLAEISQKDSSIANRKANDIGSPANTDREMVSAMPRLEGAYPSDTAVLDSAFGVIPHDGPNQSPSYTIGVAKINDFYKKRDFEYALIEINNLLAFYPTSAKLHMMKGTILLKMQSYTLAEKSWSKALELAPNYTSLNRALKRLQQRIAGTEKSPKAVPLTPSQKPLDQEIETLAH